MGASGSERTGAERGKGVSPGANGSASTPSGRALHPRLYRDPAVATAELERIIERSWQLAGHVSAIAEPGTYMTTDVGSQPVLVVRDAEGTLRAFRNVCRHRGSKVLSGSGACGKALRCRYHGWTYRLDGSLIGMSEVRSFANPDKGALGLLPVAVEEVCGLVFVNLDPGAEPLTPQLGDLPERLARYRIPELLPFHPYDGHQPVNWKIIVDNYLEGYHVPIAHPGLMRLLDYARYRPEVNPGYVWFEAPMRDRPSGDRMERAYQRLVRPMPGLGPEDERVWRYIFIYPNTAIDLYPDQVMTWQINPDGVYRTHDVFMAYRAARPGLRTRLAQKLNEKVNWLVHREDMDLVANVQAGLETRGYACGPLSEREAGVAWFADRVRADLGEVASEIEGSDGASPEAATAAVAAG
jgi:Rieske 2Fe-2S family protein